MAPEVCNCTGTGFTGVTCNAAEVKVCGSAQQLLTDSTAHYMIISDAECPNVDNITSKDLAKVEVGQNFELHVENSTIQSLVANEGILVLSNVNVTSIASTNGGSIVIQGNVNGGGELLCGVDSHLEVVGNETISIEKEVIVSKNARAQFKAKDKFSISGMLIGRVESIIEFLNDEGVREVGINGGVINSGTITFGIS